MPPKKNPVGIATIGSQIKDIIYTQWYNTIVRLPIRTVLALLCVGEQASADTTMDL